ncbi:MAG: matrixin family metalloprotease [Vulcanococcus sp.]
MRALLAGALWLVAATAPALAAPALAAPALAVPARAVPPLPRAGSADCPVSEASRPAATPGGATLIAAQGSGLSPAAGGDYRHRLSTTPLGWPRLDRWCVWVQPAGGEGPGQRWELLWLEAVERALAHWGEHLPILRVEEPEAAQIRIERRRPPLRSGADGRTRASHGRATLELREVRRGGRWRLEPGVAVQLGSGQRPEALQATALHELGHAFGLWGHSDAADDAMAAVPGRQPLLELTERDRATVRWLYRQPTRFGAPLPSSD